MRNYVDTDSEFRTLQFCGMQKFLEVIKREKKVQVLTCKLLIFRA